MPIYKYRCECCEEEFTSRQKFDDPAPPCPRRVDSGEACSGEVKRVVARSSFRLKGAGWYSDGYK